MIETSSKAAEAMSSAPVVRNVKLPLCRACFVGTVDGVVGGVQLSWCFEAPQ